MTDLLFAYGTLITYHAPHEINDLVSKLRPVREGNVRGELFDFGDFPAVRLDPAGQEISGMVYEIADLETLRRLDIYEEFDPKHPESSLFRRERTPVNTGAGPLDCWIYVYNRDLRSAPRILSGRYAPERK
jgi:gamma-glutamylcyclotransferase (GGCT)/AIG2-like uncharacterized protein YtfP